MAGVAVFTSTSAVEVLPVPPLVELTVTEFVLSPTVVPMTVTLKEQLAPTASEPPLSEMVSCKGALFVTVSVPPHCELDEVTTSSPAGRVSVKLTPVNIVAVLGLLIVNVSAVELPVKMGFAVKALLMTGGATTVKEAVPKPVEDVLAPVSVEVIVPLTFV